MKIKPEQMLSYNDWPYQVTPAEPQTMYERVKMALQKDESAEVIRFRDLKMDGKTLLQAIEKWRGILYRLGLRKGDVITLLLPNLPHVPILLYAANAQGIIVHPLHPLTVTKELKRTLDHTGSTTLFVFAPLVKKHRELLEDPKYQVILCEARDYLVGLERFMMLFKPSPKLHGAMYWSKLSSPVTPELPEQDPFAPAVYLSSGGTTGKPKTIVLSSQNFNSLGEQGPAMLGSSEYKGYKMLAMLPFFHGFGLCMQLHTMIMNDVCSVLVPKFSAEVLAQSLKKDKPEAMCAVPTVYEALLSLDEMEDLDLSFLKAVFCGGDHLRPELKAEVDQFLHDHGANVTLREGYGLTETVTVNCVNPAQDDRAGTVGKPLPYHTFALPETDEHGIGELYVTGPSVMLGYLGDPEATAETLIKTDDGTVWVKTGDLASFEDGYVVLHGRLKRLIKVSGISVFPSEVEHVLQDVEGVEDLVCFSMPHPYKQQVVEAAVVAPEENFASLVKKLQAKAKQELMYHARPVRYHRYDAFPRTAVGKVDVPQLQEDAAQKPAETSETT